MEIIKNYWPLALTMWAFSSIIYILIKIKILLNQKKLYFLKTKGRQSTIHELVRNFLPTNEDFIKILIARKGYQNHPSKQSNQKYQKDKIKVVVIEDKAYWVQDNTFYETIVTEDGNIDQSLAKPINIDEMKKEDVERLMLILDDLKREDQ
jgi:hypothetical protein